MLLLKIEVIIPYIKIKQLIFVAVHTQAAVIVDENKFNKYIIMRVMKNAVDGAQ